MVSARHVGRILKQVHVIFRLKSHKIRESLRTFGVGVKVIRYLGVRMLLRYCIKMFCLPHTFVHVLAS
jgi:hypothetical protein